MKFIVNDYVRCVITLRSNFKRIFACIFYFIYINLLHVR